MSRHERVMSTGEAVVTGQLFVADGKVVVSTVTGTVATLKAALGASVITTIDAVARRVQTSPTGEEIFEL